MGGGLCIVCVGDSECDMRMQARWFSNTRWRCVLSSAPHMHHDFSNITSIMPQGDPNSAFTEAPLFSSQSGCLSVLVASPLIFFFLISTPSFLFFLISHLFYCLSIVHLSSPVSLFTGSMSTFLLLFFAHSSAPLCPFYLLYSPWPTFLIFSPFPSLCPLLFFSLSCFYSSLLSSPPIFSSVIVFLCPPIVSPSP